MRDGRETNSDAAMEDGAGAMAWGSAKAEHGASAGDDNLSKGRREAGGAALADDDAETSAKSRTREPASYPSRGWRRCGARS